MPIEDCPERRAEKKSGERITVEGFQDQREGWADQAMVGLEKKWES